MVESHHSILRSRDRTWAGSGRIWRSVLNMKPCASLRQSFSRSLPGHTSNQYGYLALMYDIKIMHKVEMSVAWLKFLKLQKASPRAIH